MIQIARMRIFKNKEFHKWALEQGLTDESLKKAVDEIMDGLFDANLGGNIFKKRISLAGRGKRSGGRTIVGFKADNHTFFIYAFAKNKQSNISKDEEKALKALAKLYFNFNELQLEKAIKNGLLFEVII